ncbi:S9 family peptidase [Aliidiomarina halalkaliphila]|uniref:S9 family peptidase n=2 Tax=Aliidiomarina halalkaliphila TaxID=2593535 RepID=A0A552X6B1_9GAMM|nr:S9 family peptidase [Aliidiomarina halalkaliphila]
MLTLSVGISVGAAVGFSASASAQAEQARPLALTDVMQFREIDQRQISDTGNTLAFAAVPDYGDREGIVVRVSDGTTISVASAHEPKLSADGNWVVFTRQPTLLQRERAESREEERALYHHAVLVDVLNASKKEFPQVSQSAFTGDGRFLVLQHDQDYSKENGSEEGRLLRLIDLRSNEQTLINNVTHFTVASEGSRLVYQQQAATANGDDQSDTDNEDKEDKEESKNPRVSLVMYDTAQHRGTTLMDVTDQQFSKLSFSPNGQRLAFHVSPKESDYEETPHALWMWAAGEGTQQLTVDREGFILSEHSPQRWSDDGERLFIGHRPTPAKKADPIGRPESKDDLYNLERLLSDRRLQVWHGDDDMIIPHQRQSQRNLNRATAMAVWHVNDQRLVTLSDDVREAMFPTDHPQALLARDSQPYSREITWDGFYHDLYHVNLNDGSRTQVAARLPSFERGSLSPDGRYVVYVNDYQLHAFDSQSGSTHQIGSNVSVSWVDEENDRPMEAVPYGIGGWHADSSALWVYDRFDIWQVPVAESAHDQAVNLTQVGREHTQQYRVLDTDDLDVININQPVLLRGYNEQLKTSGFYQLALTDNAPAQLEVLVEGEKTWRFIARTEDKSQLFYTEEDFRTFPDVWVADAPLQSPRQLTDVNPQRHDFIWGNAQLVEWESTHGEPLQGILITPDNYDPNKRYPVLVYYYEKFSQRLYNWNQMRVNHRPNFPFYLGQDYVVFLPDVHFRLGAPGPSATESLVPGVEKIIEMGVADPDAIGLHGHSWSGYQTAFVVTETDMFSAAVSGAPVSNMTSAYSGIRWGSGLARQFQYEKGQSRLGVSMFEDLDPYIKNSPVFFADKINTPMLIQFGDKDEAVPWEQGIEYYLALRRLDKPVVMLHYEGEPHHLQQFANKIDYTIKMLEFLDHHLKGADAPSWWTEGLEFQVYD